MFEIATMIDARVVSCTSGATVGAALGALSLSSGRNVVVGAAVGAALGSVIGAACGASLENWKEFAQIEKTFSEEAASADAADEEVDYAKEANVLRAFFIGQRESLLQSACESENAVDSLKAAREQFQPWATATPEQIGGVIQSAVEQLGAPHLRPTIIAKRLDGRVTGACFEVFTLVSHDAFDIE